MDFPSLRLSAIFIVKSRMTAGTHPSCRVQAGQVFCLSQSHTETLAAQPGFQPVTFIAQSWRC